MTFKIDNTALTTHQMCPTKFKLRHERGMVSRGKSAALGFGGALHEGLATWYKTGSLQLAKAAIETVWPHDKMPVDDYRNLEKCLRVMEEYTHRYPKEGFTIVGWPHDPLIEVPFTIGLGRKILFCEHCHQVQSRYDEDIAHRTHCSSCGTELEDIEYGGIFDGLLNFGMQRYVFEHKSTSQLGSTYFRQFKPNNQVSGYCWAAEQLSGEPVAGALVNAIGVMKSSATKFERHMTSRTLEGLNAWKNDVQDAATEIVMHRVMGNWPKRTNACTLYGICEFHAVCELENPDDQERRLEGDYVYEPWQYERRDA